MTDQLYFVGKLRKAREFLIAPALPTSQRLLWENWFNRCLSGNQLLPFLKAKPQNSNIWLFVIKQDDMMYVGIGSQSQDLAGRTYPFMVFNTLSNTANFHQPLSDLLGTFFGQSNNFERFLNQGYFDTTFFKDFYLKNSDTLMPTTEFLMTLCTTLLTNMDKEPYASNWFDIKTARYIIHPNALTCSLYTKVFG